MRVVGTAEIDTEPLGNDEYGAREYELKNSGQIAGLGNDANDLNVPEAWTVTSVSDQIVVAVIDSGVELFHPDLNVITGYDADTGAVGGAPHDLEMHGTGCAGNVGAIRNNVIGTIGTAPGVKIMPIYRGTTIASLVSAFNLAVQHGAKVISNSWGGVGAYSAPIEAAVKDALAAGRSVLFSAGNGPNNPPYTYETGFPCSLTASSDVICVGASSPTDEYKGASSSDGIFTWGSSYVGVHPDVVAPGPWSYTTDLLGAAGMNTDEAVTGIDPDYTNEFGGTSSSTPKVAGIVALMLSKNPDLTPNQVKTILRNTAHDIDAPGIDVRTGAGRVDAFAAVNAVPVNFLLTVTKVGNGTVTSNPAGIDCGTTCSETFVSGTSVTLTATPSAGNTFAGWSGDCSGTTCTLSMTAAKNVIATFNTIVPISLGVALDNTTLAWSTNGDAPWFGQSAVSFLGGSAAQSGPITDNQTSHLDTTVTGPGTLTFYWKVSSESCCDKLTLSMDGTKQFFISSEVDWQQKTVAIPSGQHIISWSYSKDGSVSSGQDAGWVDQVVSPAPPPVSYLLSVSKNGQGAITSNPAGIDCGAVCSGNFTAGTSVTLTATPQTGYTFESWAGDCISTALTCTLLMDDAETVVANFKANQTITFGAAPTIVVGGAGTVTASGGASGNPVTFSSTTPAVCTTSGINGSSVAGVAAGTCTIAANQAGDADYNPAPQVTQSFVVTSTAGFILTINNLNLPGGSVTSNVEGINCGTVCSKSYTSGTIVNLQAIPLDGYMFSGWGDGCSGYANTCIVTVNAAKTVTANFEIFKKKRSPSWRAWLLSQ